MSGLVAVIESLPFAGPLARSPMAYALVSAGHVLGIAVLIGAILPLDLRLTGILPGPPHQHLAPFLSGIAAAGLGLALLTGIMLISVRTGEYLENPALRIKLALLAAAFVNIAAVHAGRSWRGLPRGRIPSAGLRIAAAISALIWLGVLFAGRMIAFV